MDKQLWSLAEEIGDRVGQRVGVLEAADRGGRWKVMEGKWKGKLEGSYPLPTDTRLTTALTKGSHLALNTQLSFAAPLLSQ